MTHPQRAKAMLTDTPQFSSVGHALGWSTEVLRRRRHAHTSRWQQEALGETEHQPFHEEIPDPMPHMDYDTRWSLALTIQNLLYQALAPAQCGLLLRRYWGDYHHPQILANARQIQEKARQSGQRVRLRYRYALRDLAQQDDVSERTIRRRLEQAQNALAPIFMAKGLLPNVD